jgi:hypothetical protein
MDRHSINQQIVSATKVETAPFKEPTRSFARLDKQNGGTRLPGDLF